MDAAGNAADPVTVTADASSVTVFPKPPDLSPVTIATTNGNPVYAKAGDTITVQLTAAHGIQSPAIAIAGQPATVANVAGNTWTGAVMVAEDSTQGLAAFSIAAVDLAGNVATLVTTTTDGGSVAIDTIAPSLSADGVPSRGYEADNLLPDLRSLLSESDAGSAISVVQMPGAGAVLVQGALTVTFTGVDAAGNSSQAQATLTVSGSLPEITSLGATHGGVPGQSEGALYAGFGVPQTGALGGKISVNGKKTGAIFAADGSLLLEAGRSAPGLGGTVITRLGEPSGDVTLATLQHGHGGIGASNDVVLLSGLSTGAPAVALQTGVAAAGLPLGVTIKSFGAIDGNGTTAFFLATLQGTGVSVHANKALCALTGPGALNLLVSQGEIVGAKAVSIIGTLVGSKGTLADERWRADDSTVGVRLTFSDKSEAIYAIPAAATTSADWTLEAETGSSNIGQISGMVITSFGLPAFGPDSFAVTAHLARGSLGVTAANEAAIIARRPQGAPLLLVRQGDGVSKDANGAPLLAGVVKSLGDPIVGSSGAVAYLETISGIGLPTDATAAIAYAADGDHPRVLANVSATAPGGGHWGGFASLVLPKGSATGPVFTGTLKPDHTAGITAANNLGLWGVDVTGTLRLLLRSGAVGIEGASSPLKKFIALVPGPGSIGAASGYDSDGDVAVLAFFRDGSQALLDVSMP